MLSTEIEFLMVLVTLILTIFLTWMVYGIARELNLGIFRRFFKLLIAAAAVSVAGRGIVLLQLSGRISGIPQGIDLVSGLVFFIFLTAAFWVLLRDWRRISLTQPVKRGGGDGGKRRMDT
ncbi:MAG: hypothetical protein QXS96_00025 [Candidatus Caldarchaeum sp.]|jgi:hypothetical protein